MKLLPCCLVFLAVATAGFGAEAGAPAEDQLPESGVNLVRERGGWINVAVEDNRLVLQFLDATKKPAPPDVARATARVVPVAREDHRFVLNLDGDRLVSLPRVRPPHVFRIFLTLLAGETDETAQEHFVFAYPAGGDSPASVP